MSPVCARCNKMQPTAEVRRTPSFFFCKDRTACAARRDNEKVERTRTGRRIPTGDVDLEGRLI